MFDNKIFKVALPATLTVALILSGCSSEPDEPDPVAPTPTVSPSSMPNPTTEPSPTSPAKPSDEHIDFEGDPDDGEVRFIKDDESYQQASLFWGRNFFEIDPASILVPESVKDSFEHTETIPNMVLSQLSESISETVLQHPFKEENLWEGSTLLREFAKNWLTGPALVKFQEEIVKYETKNPSEGYYVNLFALLPLFPANAEPLYFGDDLGIPRSEEGSWYTEVSQLLINGVSESDSMPAVDVSYARGISVPVTSVDGKDQYGSTTWIIKLKLVPGFYPGDWLISDYEFSTV